MKVPMKVRVDTDLCAGFGICVGVNPDVFAMHEDGYVKVLVSEVAPDQEDLILRAVSQCPAQALSVSED